MRSTFIHVASFVLATTPTFGARLEAYPPRQEAVNLDKFIGKIEDKCELSSDFEKFRTDLYGRYSFERSKEQPRPTVRIPPYIRPAIGHASAFNRGSHTEIIVPINGLYHGLETKHLIFTVGHGNGIVATVLVFKSDHKTVERSLRDHVIATKNYLENDSEGKEMMMEVDLKEFTEGMAIFCDQST